MGRGAVVDRAMFQVEQQLLAADLTLELVDQGQGLGAAEGPGRFARERHPELRPRREPVDGRLEAPQFLPPGPGGLAAFPLAVRAPAVVGDHGVPGRVVITPRGREGGGVLTRGTPGNLPGR